MILVKDLQQYLKICEVYGGDVDGIWGLKTEAAIALFCQDHYLDNYQTKLIGSTFAEKLITYKSIQLLTYQQFRKALPRASQKDIDLFHAPINKAFREFEINTLPIMAAFLAQIAHESGSLRWKEEIASGAAYENRRDLGNIYPGDGRLYKGRGIIQLTGRSNYKTVGKALQLPLEQQPELAMIPINSARIAGYFWQSRGLNQLADRNAFREITRRINGGYNGLSDRIAHWEIGKKALMS